MLDKLKSFLAASRSSLWFVPNVMVGGAVVLAFALVQTDTHYQFNWATHCPLRFAARADGPRGTLSTHAASWLQCEGVAVSVALSRIAPADRQEPVRSNASKICICSSNDFKLVPSCDRTRS